MDRGMWDWVRKADELSNGASPFAIVTVIAAQGSAPREVGAKMIVNARGAIFGTIGGGQLEQLAIGDATSFIRGRVASADAKVFRYPLGASAAQCCGGVVEVLIESINCQPRLYLFGAGHVAQALCRVMGGGAFHVDVVDERSEWLEQLPNAAHLFQHAEPWDQFIDEAAWDSERTFVVVMTHAHDIDQAIIEAVLKRDTRYIGLIGSRTKWAKFRARLEARGVSREALARVRCPVGIAIGGKSPHEVAISIAAELISTLHQEASKEREVLHRDHPHEDQRVRC